MHHSICAKTGFTAKAEATPNPIREISVIRGQDEDFEKGSKPVLKHVQMPSSHKNRYRAGLALYGGFRGAGRPLWNLFPANPHYRCHKRKNSQNNKQGGYL